MGRRVLLMWSHFLALACAGMAHAEAPLFTSNELLDIELHGPLEVTLLDTDERAAAPFQLMAYLGEGVKLEIRDARNRAVMATYEF